jgi:uncharacterized protein YdeI (YjbR/CyaY-like superfamily)
MVHKTCPDVEEVMKWSFPHFIYQGENLCSMAAFKKHCAIGFWKASLMKDERLMKNAREESSMGHLGKITSLDDLPADKELTGFIREAMKLNEDGIKIKKPVKAEKKELIVPEFIKNALRKNQKAMEIFEKFSHSHKKEYIEWITEAKTEETRVRRMNTALEWIAENKTRNWKYIKK